MFKVYWTDHDGQSCGIEFTDMAVALKYTMKLRNENSGRFISLVSENPDCTSLMGVSAPSPDYNWPKRR